MKYLLFGKARHCRDYAKEKDIPLDDYKIVKHTRDFYGYRGVELVYLGDHDTINEYALYHEARKYFIAKGDIKED